MQCCVITVYRMLSDTLAKMDGLSEKDAPSRTSPALPPERTQGETSLRGSTPGIHLETYLSKIGEVLRGREKKRIPAPSKLCCCSTLLAKEAGQQRWKKLLKRGKGKYVSETIVMLVFWDTHRVPDLGGYLLFYFLKTAGGRVYSLRAAIDRSGQNCTANRSKQEEWEGVSSPAFSVFVYWEHWKVSTWEWGRGWRASVLGRRLKHTEQMAKLIYP